MTMIEKIDMLLKANNSSRGKAEKALGFGNGVISTWAKSSPRVESLAKLAKYLNTTVDYLISDDDEIAEAEADKNVDEIKAQQRRLEKMLVNSLNDIPVVDDAPATSDYLESLITCYLLLSDQGKRCLASIAANLKEAEALYIKDLKGGK